MLPARYVPEHWSNQKHKTEKISIDAATLTHQTECRGHWTSPETEATCCIGGVRYANNMRN